MWRREDDDVAIRTVVTNGNLVKVKGYKLVLRPSKESVSSTCTTCMTTGQPKRMAGSRALTRRVKRIEETGKPKPSLIAVWYGSFDAWVEQAVLPGVESGALEPDDMVDVVAALRSWEDQGLWTTPI